MSNLRKKFWRLTLATVGIAVTLQFAGCSFIVDLYVMNLGSKPVTVVYRMTPGNYSQLSYKPTFFPIEGSEKYYQLGVQTKGTYSADTIAGVVTLQLPPGQAVDIGETMNYHPDTDTLYTWSVVSLDLVRPASGDTLRIPGDSLGHHFIEMPGRIYAIPVRD